jgi:methylmalonyl-CoA mutase N-terminal domain/subunit
MERQVEEYFTKIEQLGGVIPAIEKGFFQQEIAGAAYQYQKEIEGKKRVIVGVNDYTRDEKITVPLLEVKDEVVERQIARLRKVKAERDNDAVKAALENVRRAAQGTTNLMPPILEAVKAYASIGEICDVFREVFGEWQGDRLI